VFAAVEVVRYGRDSVLYVFGDKTGDKTADRILDAIRTEGPKTRSELHLIFSGNMRAQQLQTALDLLLELEYAQCEYREPNEGGTKPVEVWTATNR
jgi:glycine/serine hydroxymethyltransferase